MMRKLLFMLLMVVAATATINAQDEPQQTLPPCFTVDDSDNHFEFTFEDCNGEGAIVYYRYRNYDDVVGWTDWMEYTQTIVFNQPGQYSLEFYAVAPGMLPSEHDYYDFLVVQLQTQTPCLYDEAGEGYYLITLEDCNGEGADIYYRYCNYDLGGWTDWMEYTQQLVFDEPGDYDIEYYGVAPGMLQSETSGYSFMVEPVVMEQTQMPEIWCYEDYDGYHVQLGYPGSEDGVALYYRYGYQDLFEDGDYDWSEWMQAPDQWYSFYLSGPGNYIVQCYAVAPGKLPSETAELWFEIGYHSGTQRDYDFMAGNIYYSILSDSTVAVSKKLHNTNRLIFFSGENLYLSGDFYPSYSGDLTIPSTVEHNGRTYTVTAIKREAFLLCDGLDYVTLPSTITDIGDYAFSDLIRPVIYVNSSLKTIGVGAFYNCELRCNSSTFSSVTSIGDFAFADSKCLYSVNFSDALTSIGKYAFSDCLWLTSATFAGGLTAIGERAFKGCENLHDVTLPSGLETIGKYAFYGCESLSSIAFPATLISIGDYAFSHCEHLATAPLPASLTTIGNSAFSRCTALTAAQLPDALTSLGNNAYFGCTSLADLTLPAGLTAIKYSTFANCSTLTAVNLPSSLTSIGYDAFSGCTSLTSIAIPAAVTSISDRAFDGCSSLASVQVAQGNPNYDSRDNSNALIETASNTLLLGCKNTTIPATVTVIGERAFFNCTGLTSITIPELVTTIGDYAFYNCTGVTSVTSQAVTPPACEYWSFGSCYDATLHVPLESLGDYRSAEYWKLFKSVISGAGYGDIDGNGEIGMDDLTILINLLLAGGDLPASCDVNGDGRMDMDDLTALINLLLAQ